MEMMMQAGDSAEKSSELSDSEHQVVPSITRGNMRSWGGMRIAWICVGVDDYRYIDKRALDPQPLDPQHSITVLSRALCNTVL